MLLRLSLDRGRELARLVYSLLGLLFGFAPDPLGRLVGRAEHVGHPLPELVVGVVAGGAVTLAGGVSLRPGLLQLPLECVDPGGQAKGEVTDLLGVIAP